MVVSMGVALCACALAFTIVSPALNIRANLFPHDLSIFDLKYQK